MTLPPFDRANGARYIVAIGGAWYYVYGTSASSPVVGAIITLINDARLALGKSTVGFINPVLVRQFSFPAPTVAQWNCILYTVRTVLTVPSSLLHVK